MPAFIFMSGLFHKQNHFRPDNLIFYVLCGYVLKIFIFISQTLMGLEPEWHGLIESSAPWYLFVLAEYELLFCFIGRFRASVVISAAFLLSSVIGYFPAVGDGLCLARAVNFLPIYAIGYYLTPQKVLEFSERYRTPGITVFIGSFILCMIAPWEAYGLRKWFTGRNSYEYLATFFEPCLPYGWIIRLGIWAVALVLIISAIAIMPNKRISAIGERTIQVYFWHRPVCYLFTTFFLMPGQFLLPECIFIGCCITGIFSCKVFRHPIVEIQNISRDM